jgi:hypothetical protein
MLRIETLAPAAIPRSAPQHGQSLSLLFATAAISLGLVLLAFNSLVGATWHDQYWLTWLTKADGAASSVTNLLGTLYDLGDVGRILFDALLASDDARIVAKVATISALAVLLWAIAMRPHAGSSIEVTTTSSRR